MRKIKIVILVLMGFVSVAQSQITVEFSATRGFYDSPFDLTISSSLDGATIRFTINGDEPSLTEGAIYDGAIPITTTTILRAIAYQEGVDTSQIYTHTYLFLEEVIRQPKTIEGWPNNSYSLGGSGSAIHDYEMDPSVVGSPIYNEDLLKGLREIPTMSIVMPKAEFWEMYDGEVEKKTSIEVIYPGDEEESEQVDCGIEPHSHFRLKRSMRLSFKKVYGKAKWKSKIFRSAIVGGDSAVDEFDRIVLRGGNNRAWSRNWNEDRTAFTRDEWFRQSQIASSGIGSHGNFVHLYVNGLYWGLYNPVERPDESFTSSYLGGEKEDWFAVSHGGDQGGDASRYDYMMETFIGKDLTISENYKELESYLDIPQFIDYLVASWMTGVQDWPKNNWWGGNSNNPAGTFKYFGWDNEWSWDVTKNANNGAWVHPDFRANDTEGKNAALLFNKAKVNQDFMMVLADRVYKLCFNDGPLSDANSRARWNLLNNYIRNAVVAESARWGDSLEDGITRTRDNEWQNEVDRLDGLMDGNVDRLMNALLQEDYYPDIEPPLFVHENTPINLQESSILKGYSLDLVNPNASGEIYYTLDGTDPRLDGGTVSANALLSEDNPLMINGSVSLQARVKDGDSWSALHCLNLFILNDLSKLKLTEIMYHPTDFGTVEGRNLEFLEIKNTSATDVLDLGGVEVSDGVDFTFPIGTLLNPFEHLVIASNREALRSKCPEVEVFGEYDGQLSNAGERIQFTNREKEVLISVTYDDEGPWPEDADGLGNSLISTLVNPQGDQDNAMHWKVSADNVCGSPGQDDALSTAVKQPHQLSKRTTIYPNPGLTNDRMIIRSMYNIRSIQLTNSMGSVVKSIEEPLNSYEYKVKNPEYPGIYIVRILFYDGSSESHIINIL